MHRLIAACPPLDLNSVYLYLLLAEHFPATCILAEDDQGLLGLVTAYLPPGREDTLFVWQVAVHERARGQGLAQRMIESLLARPGLEQVRHIETTVGPDNLASRHMFAGLARKLRAPLQEQTLFTARHFAPDTHEAEPLLCIGPFDSLAAV